MARYGGWLFPDLDWKGQLPLAKEVTSREPCSGRAATFYLLQSLEVPPSSATHTNINSHTHFILLYFSERAVTPTLHPIMVLPKKPRQEAFPVPYRLEKPFSVPSFLYCKVLVLSLIPGVGRCLFV